MNNRFSFILEVLENVKIISNWKQANLNLRDAKKYISRIIYQIGWFSKNLKVVYKANKPWKKEKI